MTVRKVHRVVALVFSPFFLLTAGTGILLLWRKAGLYGNETKEGLLGIHNWERLAPYVGAVLGAALIAVTISGLLIWIQILQRRRKSG